MIDVRLVYGPTAEISARALIKTGAYLIADPLTDFFEWKSGVKAPVYTDCRVVPTYAGPFATLVRAMAASIEANFSECNVIVGMAEAGVVWSSAVAYELGMGQGFVRKTKKSHGTHKMVEGRLNEQSRVVLVDDLIAGGETSCLAVDTIKSETGAEVIGIQSIVNWDFVKMRERLTTIGVEYRALVSFPQLLEAAVFEGRLSQNAAAELKFFYRNPSGHQWNLDAFSVPAKHDDLRRAV